MNSKLEESQKETQEEFQTIKDMIEEIDDMTGDERKDVSNYLKQFLFCMYSKRRKLKI
jgi:hypothetical protein